MKLRAIATDIDRTLTDDALVMDLDAIRVIRLLEAAGLPVILASGRDIIALGTLAPYLGTSGVVVAEDGAVVGRFGPMSYQTRLLGRPERVQAALTALKEAFGSDIQVVPIPSRLASLVLVRCLDLETANRFLRESGLAAKLLDSGLSYELADADVDKGTGLIEAVALLGIGVGDVAAIGDSPNDLDMFRVAGWCAAVGNAAAQVKAEATYACALPHGQGFVEAVREVVSLFRPDLAGLPWPGSVGWRPRGVPGIRSNLTGVPKRHCGRGAGVGGPGAVRRSHPGLGELAAIRRRKHSDVHKERGWHPLWTTRDPPFPRWHELRW